MNNETNYYLDKKVEATMLIFKSLYTIFGSGVFSSFCFWGLIKGADTFTRVAILPFLICGVAVLINGIATLIQAINMHKAISNIENGTSCDDKEIENIHKKMEKVNKFTNNLYIYSFLTFWFGFLIVFDYLAIEKWSEGGDFMFFFSLIFWAAGILIFITKRK